MAQSTGRASSCAVFRDHCIEFGRHLGMIDQFAAICRIYSHLDEGVEISLGSCNAPDRFRCELRTGDASRKRRTIDRCRCPGIQRGGDFGGRVHERSV
ncbi:hypothetical protein [uncultured Sphingomonas sp.]|uniref:hypothetical protein n=1 Tax=uncultured Sphingomonas sp. TaxID=158754 RepID=UPI0035CA6C47